MTKETRTTDLEERFTELVDRYLYDQGLAIKEVIEQLILNGIPLEWLRENMVIEVDGKPSIHVHIDREAEKIHLKMSEKVTLRLKTEDDAA